MGCELAKCSPARAVAPPRTLNFTPLSRAVSHPGARVNENSHSTAAEILVLRRQLALYKERAIKPRRIDRVTRISLALLSRFFNWREALVVVRPETMIRWHRAGWKLFWRLKSRPGRPPIPLKIQALIRRKTPRRVDRKARSQGVEITTTQSDSQCDLRTSHRHNSSRVP